MSTAPKTTITQTQLREMASGNQRISLRLDDLELTLMASDRWKRALPISAESIAAKLGKAGAALDSRRMDAVVTALRDAEQLMHREAPGERRVCTLGYVRQRAAVAVGLVQGRVEMAVPDLDQNCKRALMRWFEGRVQQHVKAVEESLLDTLLVSPRDVLFER